jgi:EAL domain
LKQSVCRRMLERAKFYGSRTVADGIETWSDFLTVRDLGFDLVQGSLFAKPMSEKKFAQTCWAALHASAASPLSRSIERLSLAGGSAQPAETGEQLARLSNRDTGSMVLSARRFTSRCALECVAHGEKHLLQRCFEHAEVGHV